MAYIGAPPIWNNGGMFYTIRGSTRLLAVFRWLLTTIPNFFMWTCILSPSHFANTFHKYFGTVGEYLFAQKSHVRYFRCYKMSCLPHQEIHHETYQYFTNQAGMRWASSTTKRAHGTCWWRSGGEGHGSWGRSSPYPQETGSIHRNKGEAWYSLKHTYIDPRTNKREGVVLADMVLEEKAWETSWSPLLHLEEADCFQGSTHKGHMRPQGRRGTFLSLEGLQPQGFSWPSWTWSAWVEEVGGKQPSRGKASPKHFSGYQKVFGGQGTQGKTKGGDGKKSRHLISHHRVLCELTIINYLNTHEKWSGLKKKHGPDWLRAAGKNFLEKAFSKEMER